MVVEQEPSRRRGRRGPYAKSRLTRSRILDAALTVFAESGYRSGSLRDVAGQIGISEAGLLYHFGNKQALLAAVLEHRDEQNRQQFEFNPASGTDLLRTIIKLVEYNASTPGVVELFCRLSAEATSPSHPAHRYFVDRYATVTRLFREAFENMRTRGELRQGVDPVIAARGVVALLDGLQVQWLLDRGSVDMAVDLRVYLSSLVVTEI